MRWQALVTLPEHVDSSQAGQIGEELQLAINHGPVVLIADMTATVFCDNAGADALGRAYQQAARYGTELRLVVPAHAVRKVLRFNRLGHLAAIYDSLAAAVTDQRPGSPTATRAPQASSYHDLLDAVTRNLFQAALRLQAINPRTKAEQQRLTRALQRLDDTVREIRDYTFTAYGQKSPSPPPAADEQARVK